MPNRKMKDPSTGKIYIVDDEDNIVSEAPAPLMTTEKPFETSIKAPSTADIFYQKFGRGVHPALTAGGGLVGATLGGPPGSALGTATGSAIGRMLQTLAPSYLGEYNPQSVNEVITGEAGNVLLDIIGGKVGKVLPGMFPSVRNEWMERAIQSRIKPTLSTEAVDALRADPNMPLSLGQVNARVGKLEDIYAPSAKQQLVNQQNKYISKKLGKYVYRPAQVMMETAQSVARAEKEKLSGQIKTAYGAFEPEKVANTQQVKVKLPDKPSSVLDAQGNPIMIPQFKIENVEGAIPVRTSKSFADQVGAQLDEELGPNATNPAWLGANLGNPLVKLKTEIDKIRGAVTHIDPKTNLPYKDPIMSMDQLRVIRDSITGIKETIEDRAVKNRLNQGLKGLEATIRKDIDEGVKEWGAPAYKKWSDAQNLAKEKALRFSPKTAQRLLDAGTDPTLTYQAVAREALSDPQKARQFTTATGDRDYLGQIFLHDIVDKNYDAATGTYNYNGIINALDVKNEIAREAVSSTRRTNLTRLLKQAQVIGPQNLEHNFPLAFKLGHGAIGIAAGLTQFFAGGGGYIPIAALAGGTMVGSAGVMHSLMKKIVENPRLAHLATGALKANPRSDIARNFTKAMLPLMKGMQFTYMLPDGRQVPATVNKDNKIEVQQPETE